MNLTIRRYSRAYYPRGIMNKTESDYVCHLKLLQLSKEIDSFQYEPETLKIGSDCRYTPDFRVLRRDSNAIVTDKEWDYGIRSYFIEFHEVKGTSKGKPYIEDDALVKIKAAATIHPMYKFVIVWKYQGQWMSREIN